jgi:hypothetical protein
LGRAAAGGLPLPQKRPLAHYSDERGADACAGLRTGKGKGAIGGYIAMAVAAERARAAGEAVKRAKPKDRIAAEIKAHRAEMAAAEQESVMADRIARQ